MIISSWIVENFATKAATDIGRNHAQFVFGMPKVKVEQQTDRVRTWLVVQTVIFGGGVPLPRRVAPSHLDQAS